MRQAWENSQNTIEQFCISFVSVLFDFDLREWLVKQTDTKLLTSELAILQIDRPLVGKKAPQLCSFIHEETFVAPCHGIL